MRPEKFIAFFLFLILSIQVLPLKQIASWLSSGQVNEELAHTVNPVKGKSIPDDVHPPFAVNGYVQGFQSLRVLLCNPHHDEALFLRHADDILTPPPNC